MARLVFMGSPEFAVPSLEALVSHGHAVAAVVTQPDKPAGRGGRMQPPPVKVAAERLGLPVLQPAGLRNPETQETLRALAADAFVVAAYGRILPTAVLAIPRRGCINVHASLLPRWRGASPITAAILAGDRESGVSIMELVRQMDAGPVISRALEPVRPDDTAGTLEARLAVLGADELTRVLPGWLDGEIAAEAQDESQVTVCGLVSKADGWLRASMSADEAERAVRAYNPWPGASVMYNDQRLAIWKSRVGVGRADAEPGTIAVVDRHPWLALREGWLVVEEMQLPGGKRMAGEAMVAGSRGQLAPAAVLA